MRPRFRQKNLTNWNNETAVEEKKNGVQRHQPTEQTFVKKWFKALTDTKYKVFYQELKIFYMSIVYTQEQKKLQSALTR